MAEPSRKAFRQGPAGALMDELERATGELAELVAGLTDEAFEAVRDPGAEDEDLRSIQGIVRHVVRAGFAHANHIRVARSSKGAPADAPLARPSEVADQLREMLAYLEETLDGCWKMTDAELAAVEIKTLWGQTYDLEQMLEHTIVHVLRHRRQIERFLHGA